MSNVYLTMFLFLVNLMISFIISFREITIIIILLYNVTSSMDLVNNHNTNKNLREY